MVGQGFAAYGLLAQDPAMLGNLLGQAMVLAWVDLI
jgi:hypothetical protein